MPSFPQWHTLVVVDHFLFRGASTGLYVFLYYVWYWNNLAPEILELTEVLPTAIFFSYTGMISLCIGLGCGSVRFLSSHLFTGVIHLAAHDDFPNAASYYRGDEKVLTSWIRP